VPSLPSGTVTFLFTDIEGSTRLLRQLRDRYRSVIAAHGELLRAAFSLADGEVIDTQSDAFFVVFHRARDAAAAAAAAQRALAAHNWPQDGRVRVRMGLHTGEPEVAEAGYLGLGVHRAARICAAAHGGQVLLSQATASVLADEELADLDVRDLGEHRLKDFDRPVRLYQLVGDGLEADFPPPRTAGAELPLEGREQELEEAVQAAVAAESVLLRHRRLLLAAAALLVAAVGATLAVALTRGGSSARRPLAVLPNSVAVINAKTNGVVRDVTLGASPTWVARGAGAVWASETIDNQIARIDERALQMGTKGLPGAPGQAIVGAAGVFVSEFQGARMFHLSPTTGDYLDSVDVIRKGAQGEFGLGPVAMGRAWLWIYDSIDSTLVRIRPGDLTILKRTPTPETISALGLGENALWATTFQQDVLRIDRDTDRVSGTTEVARQPNGIAVAGDTVWVADGPKALAIDAGTGVIQQTVTIGTSTPLGAGFGQGLQGIAVAGNDVWVTDPVGGRVFRLDARDGTVKARIHVGHTPAGLAVGGGRVWVAIDP
jgi:class 3 adenylate cyclase/outer membrane protein assembly factor BamB